MPALPRANPRVDIPCIGGNLMHKISMLSALFGAATLASIGGAQAHEFHHGGGFPGGGFHGGGGGWGAAILRGVIARPVYGAARPLPSSYHPASAYFTPTARAP